MQLEALFKQPQALPAIPKIVHELIDSFNSDDISIDEIARKLAAEPVLSARLLRLANSAYYHVSRSIGTVNEALAMLGFVVLLLSTTVPAMAAACSTAPTTISTTILSRWALGIGLLWRKRSWSAELSEGSGWFPGTVGQGLPGRNGIRDCRYRPGP